MTAKNSHARSRKRLLILDDHPMMREGLAQLINQESDLMVCAEAGTGRDAIELIGKHKPDLVLADISLPDKSGLEVIKEIQTFHPGLDVLVISMHEESLYAQRVLRAGARGYIMKQEGGKKLMEAIRCVLGGRIYVSETMSVTLLESLSGQPGKDKSPLEQLSEREFEVLELLGQGLGTREIADRLHLSVKTVDTHRANIKRKLNLKTASELVRYCVRWMEAQGG